MNCMAVLECVENTVLGENHNASHCVKYLLKVRYEALLCTGRHSVTSFGLKCMLAQGMDNFCKTSNTTNAE